MQEIKPKLITKIGNKVFGHDSTHEVPNKELGNFMLGIIGQNLCYAFVSGWFMFFCTDVMKIEPLLVGSVLSISRVWDAINDPIVGSIVDMHIFKNGEKLRPLLKILGIPIGLIAAFMFVDLNLPTNIYLVFMVTVYFGFDLLYSFQDVAQWGMTSLMATSSSERARVAQFARIAGTMGGWLPGLIPIILDITDKANFSHKTLFLIFGIIFGLFGMTISTLTYRAKERAPVEKIKGSPFASIKLVAKNKIVVLIVLGSILSHCTLVVDQVYFFKYMITVNIFGIQINGLTMSVLFGIIVGLPGMLSMFFAVWFSKRIGGMRNILVLAVILNICLRLVAFAIGYQGIGLLFVGICLAIIGIPNGMIGIATTSLWGDSLDYMEWKTGERNEGAVFAMQNFTSKINNAIKIFFMGLTLSLLKFDSNLYDQNLPQSDTFNKYVWPVFILGPALGAVFNLIPLLFIKYNKHQKAMVEEKLKYIRGVKAGTIIPHDEQFKDYSKLDEETAPNDYKSLLKHSKFTQKKEKDDDITW